MIFPKIAGDISEIAGDLGISEQSVKKIIIPALAPHEPDLDRVHAWGSAPCVHPVKARLIGGARFTTT